MRSAFWPAVALALCAAAAEGQAARDGSRDVDGSRLRPAVWELRLVMERNGQQQQMGVTRYELIETGGSDPRWVFVQTTTSPRGTMTDSSIVRRADLLPVAHRGHTPQRTLTLDFAGLTVTGSISPATGAATPIKRATSVPTFDGSTLDLILAALPLATGYLTRLPVYIEEAGGLAWLDISVAGEEKVDLAGASHDGWTVLVKNPMYTVQFTIDKQSRQVLRGVVEQPGGVRILMLR